MTEAQKTLYYIAENMKMDKSISEEGYKHFHQAIKALEQEDVLDKIKAEIEELDRYYDRDYFSTNNCPMYKCNEVLLIIDKYRESENKE